MLGKDSTARLDRTEGQRAGSRVPDRGDESGDRGRHHVEDIPVLHAEDGYLSVHAVAMAPQSIEDATKDCVNNWEAGLSTGTYRCFQTEIHLPKKARIQSVTFYYRVGASFDGWLFRSRFGSLGRQDIAEVHPASNDPTAIESTTASVAGVKQTAKNKRFAYGLGVCIEPVLATFNGARIKYTYLSAGD